MHNDAANIIQNTLAIRAELSRLARDPARPPALLPVTKTQPAERVLALRDAGIDAIGENRVQEILEKYPALNGDFSFHLIGRLQTNKIKYIIDKVCLIQSLDRWPLAEALNDRAARAGLVVSALVEVNIGGEPQKAGVAPDELEPFLRRCAGLPGVAIRGLMAVMPAAENPEALRPLFAGMRVWFERMRALSVHGVAMDELSMGMSHDYRVAAQEGATIVRIGSAIFGERALAERRQHEEDNDGVS